MGTLPAELIRARQLRLRATMRDRGVSSLLTPDPISIAYGCGARNMTVFGMMGPTRFLLLFADGPAIVFEFAGCEHLSADLETVDEVRPAPSISAHSRPDFRPSLIGFAAEVAREVEAHVGERSALAVERVDFAFTDALRSHGLQLTDATEVMLAARRVKEPEELAAMREAITRVELGVECLEAALREGATEVEVWAAFHRDLIAREGEYISTRLLQGGPNTFPYFQEAGSRPLQAGELLCLDTDAIGYRGYAVDFSRTFVCGDGPSTARQRELHAMAHEQLQHNAGLVQAGRSYEDLARRAWPVPEAHQRYSYYCLLHGIGVAGEPPNVPRHQPGLPYPLAGELEAGMVVCVESYIGDPASEQGVKLEDQYLVTERGAERLTTYPFDPALSDS